MYDIVLGAGFQTVDQPATFWVAKMLLGPVAPRLLNFMSQLRKKRKKKDDDYRFASFLFYQA